MNEVNNESTACQPEQKEDSHCLNETPSKPEEAEAVTVPIKFNKEVKHLSIEQAGALAQKGLKYDMISDNYERIKKLAKSGGVSVCDFLATLEKSQIKEKEESLIKECGGNKEMARHILDLESSLDKDGFNGFSELSEKIPEIKDISQIPAEVLERSCEKGSRLLDEFLRYQLEVETEKKRIAAEQKRGSDASIGSQHKAAVKTDSATQFLKGIWG